ncbi:DEAD/DEAH box helicase [Corallococcus interemptor]|uniref:DEAD/DEAH box helicase n=1 Tax=Corallococcus interemptor TaxID=2316720 RepID=A0A3A8QY20_9BACT|nr:DEAD/DEAH box helicase [Corallococcus interemptor]RKH71355.1 DEAD/DEAH box helicase [Corallococcus interemptor]
MAGLERLHPHLQHAIIHDLDWRSLRPVQELTIDAILDGCNAVVLAPTAGGKTEASIFPVLSRILTENLKPVCALYVCPIRALLNNQEERLSSYARMVGLDVFKWHGDVSDSKKKKFRETPAHILMTTPESLEVMMISERTDAKALFSGLSAVIIDEVHAFAADDRGAHLASLLERLVAMTGRDIQRIGLSATVGNPYVIGEWLQGSSKRPFRLVDPPKAKAQRDLRLDLCVDISEAAKAIGQVARGKKSLVFVESRSRAEKVAHALAGTGVEVFIHHSSVSRADRTLAEEQFAKGQNTAIVCTSTMELGIDVGDLDQVIQVDAPASVASFLQRLGRTGRRANTRANCTFFCLSSESLLQSVALLRLAEAGWVEDVTPAAHAMHVLAHQVMALILQEGGISRHTLMPWVEAAYPFSSVRPERVQELVDTMLEREILYEADGLLSLGQRGEKLYGRKNFFELYAVFTAPPVMRVQHGKEDVGYIQALFVSMHDASAGPLCFRLSGRAWEVGQIDYGKGVLHVRPADYGRVPSWLGLPGVLSNALCQGMLDVLLHEKQEGAWLSKAAAAELAVVRDSYDGLLEEGTAPLEDHPDGVQWHTFAGGAVNRLLAAGLEQKSGKKWVAGNLSLRCKDIAFSAADDAIRSLADLNWERVAAGAAREMARGMLSKFQPCLPEEAEDRLLSERLLDQAGTLRFLANVRVNGSRVAARPTGMRLADVEVTGPLPLELTLRGLPGVAAAPKNDVQWVDTLAALRAVSEELRAAEVVGLDVETALDFGTLYLLQIATRTRTFLIDPLAVGDLQPIVDVLSGPTPLKVIHNARFERRVLAALGIALDGVFDTLAASRRARGTDALGGHSLAMVCERELGIVLDKSSQTSNWSRRPLEADQLSYAALDAEILLALYDRFKDAGVAPGAGGGN